MLTLTTLLVACNEEELPALELAPHCNPLSSHQCLLPWPSSTYLIDDPSTPTGRRIHYPSDALPETTEGQRLDNSRYNLLDGFSIGSQIMVTFEGGVSTEGLPTSDALDFSLSDQSPIMIIDMELGDRVPLFAELDANVETDSAGEPLEDSALIIRPQTPLHFNTRYLVAIRVGLKSRGGSPLAPPEPFRRIRDGDTIKSAPLQAARPATEEVLTFLESRGIPRAGLVLAWDFYTSSQESTRGRLQRMVEEAISRLPEGAPAFHHLLATDHGIEEEPELLRTIEGQIEVPSFLETDDPDSWLKLDDKGEPVFRANQGVPFKIIIPRCAEQGEDLPVLIFGHGLFRHRHSLSEDHQKMIANRLCMVTAAVDWIGLSFSDLISILKSVVHDFSDLPRITDQLQQAHVNMHVLVRLFSDAFKARPEMHVNDARVTTASEIYYLGYSNGGIQGLTFAALNDRIQRYVLGVPGGWWSMMLPRSSNFTLFNLSLSHYYPSALDRLILFNLSQHLWDHTDPIVFTEGLLTAEPTKQLLMQEALDDVEVSNLTTRAVARGLGIPALIPAVQEVHGLVQKSGPLSSAYVQWETHQIQKPPGTNVTAPSLAKEESAHLIVRTLDSNIRQIEAFLKPDGQVVHTCDGPCDPD